MFIAVMIIIRSYVEVSNATYARYTLWVSYQRIFKKGVLPKIVSQFSKLELHSSDTLVHYMFYHKCVRKVLLNINMYKIRRHQLKSADFKVLNKRRTNLWRITSSAGSLAPSPCSECCCQPYVLSLIHLKSAVKYNQNPS